MGDCELKEKPGPKLAGAEGPEKASIFLPILLGCETRRNNYATDSTVEIDTGRENSRIECSLVCQEMQLLRCKEVEGIYTTNI